MDTETRTDAVVDVAVVGGGPAGLAAALLVHHLGRSVVLVAPAREPDARTTALLAGSVGLFERIGLWDELRGAGAPLRRIRIIDGTRRLIRARECLFDAAEIDLEAFGYNIPNEALVSTLEKEVAARGIRRIDAIADTVETGEMAATVRTAGDSVTARLVVAADGRRSLGRDAADIGATRWRYEQSALVVNLAHERPHHDVSTEFHTEQGPFTLVPLPGKRSSLVWVARPSEAAGLAALDADAFAVAAEARAQSILGAMTVDGPRQVFPLTGLQARRLAGRRIVLVGEAAHVMPPIGAQGLNLGLRDVAEIAELFSGAFPDPGSEAATAAFDRARRNDVFARAAFVDTLNRSLLSGFLPVQGLRGAGLYLLDRVPAMRRAVMRRGLAALSDPRG